MKISLNGNLAVGTVAILVALTASPASTDEKPATTAVLLDAKDLSAWREPVGQWYVAKSIKLADGDPRSFVAEKGSGVLINGPEGRTSNLLSRFEHGDVVAHVEFCVPEGSNSGVYFMGRYEIQVFDSWKVEQPKYADCGGIYERWKDDRGYEGHGPRVNASRAPGDWQTFDVVFRAPRFDKQGHKTENARFVKVVHNGQVIHENVEVTGPTRAATYENEAETSQGPLMLQGDHGPVAYRNIRLESVAIE